MSRSIAAVISPSTSTDNAWIVAELGKGIDSERMISGEAKTRGETPPDPSLGVLYHEIAAADERHAAVIERIATRYGHTPAASGGNAIGDAIGQIKERLSHLTSSPIDQLCADLQAKSRSVHWLTAWTHALKNLGDKASARELSAVLKDDKAHQDALQQVLNRLIEQQARGTLAG